MSEETTISVDRLRRLEPLSALSEERLQELVSLAYVEPLSMGVSVFREGDVDNQTVYLLKGDAQLLSSDGSIDRIVTSRTEESRFPLDDSQPRQASCTALTQLEIVRIDNSVLDYMMMWDQLAESEVGPEVVTNQGVPDEMALTPEEGSISESRAPLSAPCPASEAQTDQNPDQSAAEPITQPETQKISRTVDAEPTVSLPGQTADRSIEIPTTPTDTVPPVQPTAGFDTSPVRTRDTTVAGKKPHEITQRAQPPMAIRQAPAVTAPVKPGRPGEWIRKMHHIMAFKNLPPANVKALLEKMERVALQAGDTIVTQGESGDYYYVLVDGEADVTRTIELATLSAGASFGEESLVSGTERNATVTMKTPGAVMRLSKDDFNELLREPMLNRISPEEGRSQVLMGAVWLDVRHAREYQYGHFRGAINIPLHELRMRMDELDRDVHYICCCRTGNRSSAAAFILVQKGYQASVLSGGIQVMPQDLQKDPAYMPR